MSSEFFADYQPERPGLGGEARGAGLHDLAVHVEGSAVGHAHLGRGAARLERARMVGHGTAAQAVRERDQAQARTRLDPHHVEPAVARVGTLERHAGAEGARRGNGHLPRLARQQLAPVAVHQAGERLGGESRRQGARRVCKRAEQPLQSAGPLRGGGRKPGARHVHERALAVEPAELELAELGAVHGQPAGVRQLVWQLHPAREVVRGAGRHHCHGDASSAGRRRHRGDAAIAARHDHALDARDDRLLDLLDVEAPHLSAE
jgi:hypothetical protein